MSNNWSHLSRDSYEGHFACGRNCYLLSYYLKKKTKENKTPSKIKKTTKIKKKEVKTKYILF